MLAAARPMIFLACLVLSVACAESEPSPEPVPMFEFTLNGSLVQWNGPSDGKHACFLCGPHMTRHPAYISLSSSDPKNYGYAIGFSIPTTQLSLTTYSDTVRAPMDSLTAFHGLYTPTIRAAATEIGDYASVTFTAVKEGKYYDGTFRARFTASPYGPAADKVEIAGSFYHVRLD